jgi:integrase
MTIKFNTDAKGDILYIKLIFNYGYYELSETGTKVYKFCKISTGEKVKNSQWDFNKQQCKLIKGFPEGRDINYRLKNLEHDVFEVYNDLQKDNKIISPDLIKRKLEEKRNGNENTPLAQTNNQHLAKFIREDIEQLRSLRENSSIKSYENTASKLEAFEKYMNRLYDFKDINMQFYIDFKHWFYKQNYSANYFSGQIKNIKTFMNRAIDANVSQSYGHTAKGFIKPEEDTDSIYLTESELTTINNLDFTLHPNLDKKRYYTTRNKMMIGCFTALRISDFNRLSEINIQNDNIRIKTTKMKKTVIVPVHPIVKGILDSGFDINTKLSEQKYNVYVKEICKVAGLTEDILINESLAGKSIQKAYKKYELVTSHTCRRSGATNMFLAGIDPIYIMQFTGHKTQKSFMKYIKITAEDVANKLKSHPFFSKKG